MSLHGTPKPSHLYVIAFKMDGKFIVSKETALKIMDALGEAEVLVNRYGADDIKEIHEDAFTLHPYSREKYHSAKGIVDPTKWATEQPLALTA